LSAAKPPAKRFDLLEKGLVAHLFRPLEPHYAVRFTLDTFGRAALGLAVADGGRDAGRAGQFFPIQKLIRCCIMGAMKRTFAFILAGLAAAALFAGLVHAVLVVANVSEPAATTVYGLTPRRLWATTAAMLALVSVVFGGLAMARSAGRISTGNGRIGAIGALIVGLIAVVNGGLNLTVANGGPGTGNGVVGAAAALVLGLIAMVLGGLALARSRRTV
jgi:hypothetical protein